VDLVPAEDLDEFDDEGVYLGLDLVELDEFELLITLE
jgi:hypothetical protein